MEPLVSVVITTYEREPLYVERAVSSVLKQTYKNIELFVVDDSPADYALRDDVKTAVEAYSSVHYVQHEVNKGACAARNTGMKLSQGEYIAFLDDDDEWLPEKIEKQIAVFTNERVALVYCGHRLRNDVTLKEKIMPTKYIRGNVYPKLIIENFVGSTSFPLIRKDMLEEIGGFDPKMESAQDCDVWLRLARKYEVDYVAEPLVIYHVHEGEQITANPIKKIRGLERLNEKNLDYLAHNQYARCIRELKIAPYYAATGDVGKALVVLGKCFIKYPFALRLYVKNLLLVLRFYKNSK